MPSGASARSGHAPGGIAANRHYPLGPAPAPVSARLEWAERPTPSRPQGRGRGPHRSRRPPAAHGLAVLVPPPGKIYKPNKYGIRAAAGIGSACGIGPPDTGGYHEAAVGFLSPLSSHQPTQRGLEPAGESRYQRCSADRRGHCIFLDAGGSPSSCCSAQKERCAMAGAAGTRPTILTAALMSCGNGLDVCCCSTSSCLIKKGVRTMQPPMQ